MRRRLRASSDHRPQRPGTKAVRTGSPHPVAAPPGRGPSVRQTRIRKHRSRPAARKHVPLRLCGRDPDIVKGHQLAAIPARRGPAVPVQQTHRCGQHNPACRRHEPAQAPSASASGSASGKDWPVLMNSRYRCPHATDRATKPRPWSSASPWQRTWPRSRRYRPMSGFPPATGRPHTIEDAPAPPRSHLPASTPARLANWPMAPMAR
jgi:hypothetical protein